MSVHPTVFPFVGDAQLDPSHPWPLSLITTFNVIPSRHLHCIYPIIIVITIIAMIAFILTPFFWGFKQALASLRVKIMADLVILVVFLVALELQESDKWVMHYSARVTE